MEEIIKYKTSDGNEWSERADAEHREEYLNIKAKIREYKDCIEKLNDKLVDFQNKCEHNVQRPTKEVKTSRPGDTDGYDRYSIPVLETTHTCSICAKTWVIKRDL